MTIILTDYHLRRWYGDYLSQERMPAEYTLTVSDIRNKDGVNNIIFSSKVTNMIELKDQNLKY